MIIDNIRKIFSLSPSEVSKKFLDKPKTTYDGLYYGEVVDNLDPEQKGQVKVAVYGILDKFSVSDIPWAIAESGFLGSKKGSMIIPPKGSIVTVRFQNGDIHVPIYLSSKIILKDNAKGSSPIVNPDNLVFWETDNGSYFEIKQSFIGDEINLTHSSGAKISIDSKGSITFHGLTIEDLGKSIVTPSGLGPFCALPNCIYSGAPHSGSLGISTMPVIKS